MTEAATDTRKTGKNGDKAPESSAEKLYAITIERDGEVFVRQVTIKGIPLWIPQKSERNIPLEIIGDVVDITMLPPNEEAGFPARKAMLLKTSTTHWAVPIDGPVLARQFEEQAHKPKIGDRVFVSFDGKARKASKTGWAPANLYSIAWIDKAKTEAAKAASAAQVPLTQAS